MNQRRGIFCAGCWTLDQIRIINEWPQEEALALTLATDQQGGGSAHNVSIDLRKMDESLPVFTAGMLGQDAAGDFLVEQANRWNVDTAQLHRHSSWATSFTDVMSVKSTGKRTFFHHTGANDFLTPEHINFQQNDACLLHLGLLGVHKQLDAPTGDSGNGWVTILKQARQHGLHTNIEMVSIDPQRNRQLALPCLQHLDSLIINDYEAGCLSEISTVDENGANPDACMSAAEKLLAMGAMKLVVVHYPGGAAGVSLEGERHLLPAVSLPEEHIKGSVGAGDAFTAGMLYGIHESAPLENCMQLGHIIAAASLRSSTTVGGVSSIAECVQYAGTDWLKN